MFKYEGRSRAAAWLWLVLAVSWPWQGAAEAVAQDGLRTRYVDVRLGLAAYDGERRSTYDDGFRELFEAGGAGLGLEAGMTLSPRWSAGVFLLSSRYPYLLYVDEPAGAFERIVPGESSDWIHKLGVVWRWRPHPSRRLSPYLQGGGSLAFSLLNERILVGGGPRLGAGVELPAFGAARVFAELDGILVLPGDAMDLAGPATALDFFTFFGFGLRYPLGHPAAPAPAPAQIHDVFGAEQLAVGEQGVFAADVRPVREPVPLAFSWDFGDGATAAGQVVRHRYRAPGTYAVTFTASAGDWRAARTMTTVVGEPVLAAEVVAVHMSPLVPRVGEPVSFVPVLTGTGPIACRWDLGDGTRAEGCEVTHRYVLPGAYTVQLEASNAQGAASSTRELTVRENPCADLTRLHPVYFARNESHLDVDARGFLRENIARLAACPSVPLEVQGYAEPGERDGTELAAARARAVVQYYVNLGIPASRITIGDGQVAQVPAGRAVWQYRYVTSTPRQP